MTSCGVLQSAKLHIFHYPHNFSGKSLVTVKRNKYQNDLQTFWKHHKNTLPFNEDACFVNLMPLAIRSYAPWHETVCPLP